MKWFSSYFHFPTSHTDTALFVTAGCLENDRPVGPRRRGIVTDWRLGHNLNLRHTLAALAMSRADTIASRIAAIAPNATLINDL